MLRASREIRRQLGRRAFALVALVLLASGPVMARDVQARGTRASTNIPLVHLSLPRTNMDRDFQVSDSHLLYTQSDPLMGKLPRCVSCGDPLFTAFHYRVYLADLHRNQSTFHISHPRLLLTGPRGFGLQPFSILGNWFIYVTFRADLLPGPRSDWRLMARSLSSPREILLDTPQLEGGPAFPPRPSSDGTNVAWVSQMASPTSDRSYAVGVIRTYNLRTGKRTLVLKGQSFLKADFFNVGISGRHIVFEANDFIRRQSKIMVDDIVTHKISNIGARHDLLDPLLSISRNVVAWKRPAGIVLYNLATHRERLVRVAGDDEPTAFRGKYVLWYRARRGGATKARIDLINAATGRTRPLLASSPYISNLVRVGGSTILDAAWVGRPGVRAHTTRLTVLALLNT